MKIPQNEPPQRCESCDQVASAHLDRKPRSHVDRKVYVGIALSGPDIQLAVRAGGREIAHGRFPSGPIGTAVLLIYLRDWQTPLRVAVAGAGAAALSLALAIGAQHNREVYFVPTFGSQTVSALAHYAQRAI